MVERCLAGTPFYFVSACILTSLRDYFCLALQDICLAGARHFGHRLGRVRVNSTLFSARSKIGLWGGDAPTEF